MPVQQRLDALAAEPSLSGSQLSALLQIATDEPKALFFRARTGDTLLGLMVRHINDAHEIPANRVLAARVLAEAARARSGAAVLDALQQLHADVERQLEPPEPSEGGWDTHCGESMRAALLLTLIRVAGYDLSAADVLEFTEGDERRALELVVGAAKRYAVRNRYLQGLNHEDGVLANLVRVLRGLASPQAFVADAAPGAPTAEYSIAGIHARARAAAEAAAELDALETFARALHCRYLLEARVDPRGRARPLTREQHGAAAAFFAAALALLRAWPSVAAAALPVVVGEAALPYVEHLLRSEPWLGSSPLAASIAAAPRPEPGVAAARAGLRAALRLLADASMSLGDAVAAEPLRELLAQAQPFLRTSPLDLALALAVLVNADALLDAVELTPAVAFLLCRSAALPVRRAGRSFALLQSSGGVEEVDVDDLAGVPPEFLCAANHSVMREAVCTPGGARFDRCVIEKLLRSGAGVCPVSGEPLAEEDLEPDLELQRQIALWHIQRASECAGRRRASTEELYEF